MVTRESGAFDRLLLHLIAQLLAPTLPERTEWVDRDQLYTISGRSRRTQMKLAAEFGSPIPRNLLVVAAILPTNLILASYRKFRTIVTKEPTSLMPSFCSRLDDIRDRKKKKLIIAREVGETQYLNGHRSKSAHFAITSHSGPLCLVDGQIPDEDVEIAARLVVPASIVSCRHQAWINSIASNRMQ